MALESGTTDIVATPHANAEYIYEPDIVSGAIEELQKAVGNGIAIHRGCDFHLSPQNIQAALHEPSRFAINGLGYVLVEFPDMTLFHGIESVFNTFLSADIVPIVTHPERNEHLSADISRLGRWVEMGIPLQITAQSMLGQFDAELQRRCFQMLDRGLVHFVASDAHDTVNRPPRLDGARDFLADRFDEEWADLLLDSQPRAVIEGRRLQIYPSPPRRRKRRSWFSFKA